MSRSTAVPSARGATSTSARISTRSWAWRSSSRGRFISAGFYWFGLDAIAYGVLGLAALIDLIVYRRLGDLSVCYRCHAEFRGDYRRTAPIFDLHTADDLELEWARRIGKR